MQVVKVAPDETRVGQATYATATDAQIMMNFHRFSDPDALTEARDAVKVDKHAPDTPKGSNASPDYKFSK